MSRSLPLISVIIPVYNGDRYIAEAINSVLSQNYQPLEIIVIDDGSTDKTSEIVNSFGLVLKYFYQENSGTAAARNYGISKAKGDYFAFLDADDLWVENKLKIQLEIFTHNPEIELVYQPYTPLYQNSINPDYIGRAAVYLASDYFSKFTTGTVLKIDAGLTLYNYRVAQHPRS